MNTTFLQKLQKKSYTLIESIIDNLALIMNTYCENSRGFNKYGINYLQINCEDIQYMIEKEEKRINIFNIYVEQSNLFMRFALLNEDAYEVKIKLGS